MSERQDYTEADRQSATWEKMQRNWALKLAELRARNDGDLDAIETAKLRGQIAQIKAFLALDKPIGK